MVKGIYRLFLRRLRYEKERASALEQTVSILSAYLAFLIKREGEVRVSRELIRNSVGKYLAKVRVSGEDYLIEIETADGFDTIVGGSVAEAEGCLGAAGGGDAEKNTVKVGGGDGDAEKNAVDVDDSTNDINVGVGGDTVRNAEGIDGEGNGEFLERRLS